MFLAGGVQLGKEWRQCRVCDLMVVKQQLFEEGSIEMSAHLVGDLAIQTSRVFKERAPLRAATPSDSPSSVLTRLTETLS